LPIAGLDVPGGRPRLAFGAPLPAGARGEAELVEVWLLERLPLWRVRAALGETLPAGYHWVRAEDVWLGAPALAGQVAGADWAVTVATVEGDEAIDRPRLSDAVAAVMGADSIQRTRGKPGAEKPYDLRPLLVSVEVEEGSPDQTGPAAARSGSIRLRMRTRLDPERGTGRPEEVVAALAEVAGIGLEIVELVRSRLLLASEPLD
ncbi:MAG TPA: DUF2344 domain-containing protein, partial [Candidatus Limnocylindrales bacterium]|nr:DUF2344 domain-containing protein [Candidatus Limnocylindrales bacterium]